MLGKRKIWRCQIVRQNIKAKGQMGINVKTVKLDFGYRALAEDACARIP